MTASLCYFMPRMRRSLLALVVLCPASALAQAPKQAAKQGPPPVNDLARLTQLDIDCLEFIVAAPLTSEERQQIAETMAAAATRPRHTALAGAGAWPRRPAGPAGRGRAALKPLPKPVRGGPAKRRALGNLVDRRLANGVPVAGRVAPVLRLDGLQQC